MKVSMKYNPLVSVVMSTFNEEIKFIYESIESVLNQSYTNFEFIIVLDSVNRLDIEELLEDFARKDKRVILLKNPENMGLAASLNRALSVSKGELIARMDADDICKKDRFKIQVEYLLEHKDVDLCATDVIFIDENSKRIRNINDPLFCSRRFLRRYTKFRDFFKHPTWMFRDRVLDYVKGYRLFPTAEDYDFICRVMLSNLVCENIDAKLLKYRIREGSITTSKRYQQHLLCKYIKRLYFQRKIFRRDFFNQNEIESIISKVKKHEDKANMSYECYLESKKNLYGKNLLLSFYYLYKSFIIFPSYAYGRLIAKLTNKVLIIIYKKYYRKKEERRINI